MVKLSLTFAFLFAMLICNGQIYQLKKDTSKYKNWPLYVLKRQLREPLQTSNLAVNALDIDSVNVIQNPISVQLYGEAGLNGVVEIVLKNNVRLVNYDQILSTFNIAYTYRNLPVFIDSAIAFHPKETYFELPYIKSAKIALETGTGMKYISIRTTSPIDRNAVYLRGNDTGVKLDN
jgi:hypothetical protein